MPPDSATVDTAMKWLRYARSDYQLAQMGPVENVLWETLAFHAQQTAEKAFKAMLTFHGVDFPPTHNLAVLRDLLPDTVHVPSEIEDTTGLSVYAVSARYPQDDDDITEEDYHQAIEHAKAVLDWAGSMIALDLGKDR